MDSVAAERARLQRDLDEVSAELRHVREKLSELAYVEKVKPAYVHEQEALARQLDERRARIEENLARVEERRPGSLPSLQSGTWRPLELFEPVHRGPAEPLPSAEHPWTPPTPSPRASPADTPVALSAEITQMILQRPRKLASRFAGLMWRAGDDVPTLRIIEAAALTMGIEVAAGNARERLERLGIVAAPHRALVPEENEKPLAPAARGPDAIPDARDGLTRMQRRVLWAMHTLGYRAHGNLKETEAVFSELQLDELPQSRLEFESTLNQLTHPWSQLHPLIELGARHSRLTPLAEELFSEVDELSVDLEPGCRCPRVLQSGLPLLLAKGTDGVPPHNLGALISAASHLLEYPSTGLDTLMRIVGGPDFATGGTFSALPSELYEGISAAVTVRPRAELQVEDNGMRARWVLSEFPWPIDSASALWSLRQLSFNGVSEIREEGGKIILELEHLAYARNTGRAVRQFKALTMTHLCELRINSAGEVVKRDLRELLRIFLSHRVALVKSRLARESSRPRERAHELEGLLVALEFRDRVFDILRDADDRSESEWALQHLASPLLHERPAFAKHVPVAPAQLEAAAAALVGRNSIGQPPTYARGFSERQARFILSTRKLGSLSREALLREWEENLLELDRAAESDARSPAEALVLDELAVLEKRYQRPRRTWVDVR